MCLSPSVIIKRMSFWLCIEGDKSVTTYKTKFHALSNYSTQLLTTKEKGVNFFVKGLNYNLQVLSIHMNSTDKGFN